MELASFDYYLHDDISKSKTVSAQDSVSIKKGLANLKDNKVFLGMYQALMGRAHADWLISMNFI